MIETARQVSQDYRRIHDLLAEIISEMPEGYVYPRDERTDGGCTYWHATGPDCLIGRLLHRLGVKETCLRDLDETPEGAVDLWVLYDKGQFNDLFPRDVARVLAYLQQAQDAGLGWNMMLPSMDAWWAGFRAGRSTGPY